MNFKDAYKKGMEEITPSAGLRAQLARAAEREPRLKPQKVFSRKLAASLSVICVAFVAVIAVALIPAAAVADIFDGLPFSTFTEDYSAVFDAINESGYKNYGYALRYSLASVDIALENAVMDKSAAGTPDSHEEEYSDTNIQVAGVQEADIIKTDGDFIYMVSGNKVSIVSAESGHLVKTADIVPQNNLENDLNGWGYIQDIYVNGDRLIVLRTKYFYLTYNNKADLGFYRRFGFSGSTTLVDIYDISDRTAPALVETLGQDGGILSTRMIGSTLYLVTSYHPYLYIEKENLFTYVPSVYEGDAQTVVSSRKITIAPEKKNASYVVVSGINTADEPEVISTAALLGGGTEIYMNLENLYIYGYGDYDTAESDGIFVNTCYTNIARYALNDGDISFAASGKAEGYILNQFSGDEYDGHFRLVTTVNKYYYKTGTNGDYAYSQYIGNEQYNKLTVFDMDLKEVGKIENVAPGERVYSVRFTGDIGYFVTFRQVDPLFAVDLKNPAAPVILSALKIPGFSEYLHPYADGLLFGFGKEADENGRVTGLKLSMFDVSDPADVTEIAKITDSTAMWSVASWNHKAILVHSGKKLIGFPTFNGYELYTYDEAEAEFTKLASLGSPESENFYYYYYYDARGLFIDDYFYVYINNHLVSYSLDTLDVCEWVNLG